MSKNNSTTTTSGGFGFFGALALLFIGLRLAGLIEWPWVWVLAPLWGSVLLFIVLAVIIGTLS